MQDVIKALERGRLDADRQLKDAIARLAEAVAMEARARRRLEEWEAALVLVQGAANQARRVEEVAANGATPPC